MSQVSIAAFGFPLPAPAACSVRLRALSRPQRKTQADCEAAIWYFTTPRFIPPTTTSGLPALWRWGTALSMSAMNGITQHRRFSI